MGRASQLVLLVAVLGLACGCQSQPVAFEDAMESLGKGFARMNEGLKQVDGTRLSTGMLPAEATVTFSVSSIKEKGGNVKLAVTACPEGSGEGFFSFLGKQQKGNTISVTFRTALMGPITTVTKTETGAGDEKKVVTKETQGGGLMAPEAIFNFYKTLKKIEDELGRTLTTNNDPGGDEPV